MITGCAPYQQIQEAKRKDAEFALALKNINLDTADTGINLSNYKPIVENTIREQLKDPDSAQFSGFTIPRKEVMVDNRKFVYGYSICVYVNAKNSYGGYTGKQLHKVFLRDSKVLQVKNTNDVYGNIIFVGKPVNCSKECVIYTISLRRVFLCPENCEWQMHSKFDLLQGKNNLFFDEL